MTFNRKMNECNFLSLPLKKLEVCLRRAYSGDARNILFVSIGHSYTSAHFVIII